MREYAETIAATKKPSVQIIVHSLSIKSKCIGTWLVTMYLTLAKLICLVKKGLTDPYFIINYSLTIFSGKMLSTVTKVYFTSWVPHLPIRSTSLIASLMWLFITRFSDVNSSSSKYSFYLLCLIVL